MTSRIALANSLFAVRGHAGREFETIAWRQGNRWRQIARVAYHVKYWREPSGSAKTLRLAVVQSGRDYALLAGVVRGLGRFELEYRLAPGRQPLEIRAAFTCQARQPVRIGFYILGLDAPGVAKSVRMGTGTYGGFTFAEGTALFADTYDERQGPRQTALAIDLGPSRFKTTSVVHQYLALAFPPAYMTGAMTIWPGEVVRGGMRVQRVPEPIWNPAVKAHVPIPSDLETIDVPRFPIGQYLEHWEHYAQEPRLWTSLGKGMGMFHVGFYNLLGKMKHGGPFGYQLDDRPVWCDELADILAGRKPGRERLDYFQQNTRHCEIAWGNGCNVMVAHTLFRHGKAWAQRCARAIIKAILHLEGRGFLIPDANGPLAGAWINAYDADKRRFQDHYGGQQVFFPDQGIVNYFLSRCYLAGFVRDRRIRESIERNCRFQLDTASRLGTYPTAIQPDGSAGWSREAQRYDFPNAVSMALAMSSYLAVYELGGDRKWLGEAERVLKEHLAPQMDRFEFGLVEYDHAGQDSTGACMLLIALGHYLASGKMRQTSLARRLDDMAFEHLLTFRHEQDYHLAAHSQNVQGWGAEPRNKHGFLTAFMQGSRQNLYALHLRWDYEFALIKAFETRPTSRRYAAFMNYLSHRSYCQFLNRDLPAGFGGSTERLALKPYIQDTTHLVHSTPAGMVELMHWPLYVSASDRPLKSIRPEANGLILGLTGPTRLVVDSMQCDHFRVAGRVHRTGMDVILGGERSSTVRLTRV